MVSTKDITVFPVYLIQEMINTGIHKMQGIPYEYSLELMNEISSLQALQGSMVGDMMDELFEVAPVQYSSQEQGKELDKVLHL